MKKLFVISIAVLAGLFALNCGKDSDNINNIVPDKIGKPGAGHDSLLSIAQKTGDIDSSQNYVKNGNEIIIYGDSAGADSFRLNIVSVNSSQAVLNIDSSMLPLDMGSVELVLDRVTGTDTSFEDELWRVDSIRVNIDTLGLNTTIAFPGNYYMTLESESGQVLSAYDTAGMTVEALTAVVAGCPLVLVQSLSENPDFSFIAPVDSIDAGRSDCDTTWGYKNGSEVYIASNGSDSLFIFDSQSGTKTNSIALKPLFQILMALWQSGLI